MLPWALTILVGLQFAIAVQAVGHYTIIAPGKVHPDHKYTVAVGVHDVNDVCQIKVGITGSDDYSNFQTVELKSNEYKMLDFVVPALEPEKWYNLTVEGLTGLVFKNTTRLSYTVFSPHVKIQTDKGKYKPGDTVNFRILFLDENLRPATISNKVYVWIEDPKRNRIKEYKNLELVKGVYTGEFQISEHALLGYWHLKVRNGENYYDPQVSFEVEKYVLPKFKVDTDATERVSVRDGDMQVIVKANYTYGKPVDAKVTLVIEMFNGYWNQPEKEKKPAPAIIRTTDMVNGKAKFDINIKEYAEYMPRNDTPYQALIHATVEEQFTGVMINSTTNSEFYPYRYSISCESYYGCSVFKADKEFNVPIKILYVDHSKVEDTKSHVILRFEEVLIREDWFFESKDNTVVDVKPVSAEKSFVFESHLNEWSIANFKVKLDELPEYEGYYHYYNIKVEFVDETHNLRSTQQIRDLKKPTVVPEHKEPTEWFRMNVHYKKDKWQTKIGEEVKVELNSSVLMTSFMYNIIGRGNVLHTERVLLEKPEKLYNITLVPTFMMAPYSYIYVYFIDENGEFHYCEHILNVIVELQNMIELTTPEEVKPGAETAIKIKTPVHSFVGLLAVDQSVLLLGRNNDISSYDFAWRLGAYDTTTPWQGGFSTYPGQASGVLTLTNADFFYNRTKPIYSVTGVLGIEEPLVAVAAESERDGPYGQSSQSGFGTAFASSNSPRVRTDFSETWLFANIEDTQSEEFTWTKQIPDTITSWVLSAFSINNEKGLGITTENRNIRTFQPFFISLRLPYAVKRGEVINIPALVFNYLEKDLDVEITLENTENEYEFLEASNEVINEPKRVKTVRVPANSARGVSFMIRPTVIGNTMLKFKAVSPVAGDAVHKTLKVVPEGVTKYGNRAFFINKKEQKEIIGHFDLDLPTDVVPDSQHVEFGVVGDLLGPVLNNLENLLRMPLGCGEQVTSTLIPNYMILRYLKDTNKLTGVVERKIKRNLEQGYQNILGYQNDDGSFGFFSWLRQMNVQRTHSLWLTSYVVRALHQISEHISIDEGIVFKGWDFILKHQADNGSFVESGDTFFGTQNHHLRLTAEILLTLIEHPLSRERHQNEISKGLNYITENIVKANSVNEKAFLTYVLYRAEHSAAVEHIKQLKAIVRSDEDRMWWSDREEGSNAYWGWSFRSDVETTSYLLTMLLDSETEDIQSVLPIVRWLLSQRNSIGGFYSTRDTVAGLEALIKFAKKSGYEAATMDVDFITKGSEKKNVIKINEDNSLLLQTVELPKITTGVTFDAKGKGSALIQVAYQYNVVEKEKEPSFSINTIINKETPAYRLELDVCVEYTGKGAGSNMAIVEVSLPSGYVADTENFEEIEKVKGVRLTETKQKESVIVVYFDSLHPKNEKCLPVIAYRQYPVALQKPVPVVVYDYYDTSKRATSFYEIASKLCEICEDDEECKKKCQ